MNRNRLLLGLALLIFTLLFLRTAWVGDDVYITLRTVDNFVNGHGPTWNVAERVQSYTHPLWMFLLTAIYLPTRDAYFAALFASFLASFLTFWLVAVTPGLLLSCNSAICRWATPMPSPINMKMYLGALSCA